MKIFVTGATGFIGRHLISKLKVDNQITINLFGGELSPFDTDVNTYKLNEWDPSSDIMFFKQENFDGIIHLASLYITVHTPDQVSPLVDSNVRFSTYVLECASQANISWFLNTGTFWQHYENSDYSPVNLYAATKQAFEAIAQYFWETRKIMFVTLKLSDTFGPKDTRPKIFSLWEKVSVSGEKIEMSPGEQIIDISHVDDIVSAFILLSMHLYKSNPEIKNGDVFAVKAEKRYSLKTLAKIYEQQTGRILNISWGGRPYREREVMEPWTQGKVVPGWHPRISLEKGIADLYQK